VPEGWGSLTAPGGRAEIRGLRQICCANRRYQP
jgi:hypothetical protein